jgi:amidase
MWLLNVTQIILGKASLSEWANFRGNVPSGFSGHGGQALTSYLAQTDPFGPRSRSGISADIAVTAGKIYVTSRLM